MLTFTAYDLARCRAEGRAVLAVNIYNAEQAVGVVQAAERSGTSMLLQAGSSSFAHLGRNVLTAICLTAARASSAHLGVHVDHCRDLDEIQWCLNAGYSSVMFDGSAHPYAENIDLTRRAARLAHSYGAWIEAELVGYGGDEDVSTDAAVRGMTEPHTAAEFVSVTGVDALAVAVGNVHGQKSVQPQLNVAHLSEIADAVSVPLVLHGASGLPPDVLTQARARGVAKINVNTELRRAFLAGLDTSNSNDSLTTCLGPAVVAVRERCLSMLEILSGAGSAEAR